MKHNTLRIITFANGRYPMSMDKINFKVQATQNLVDGDFKTNAIHGPRKLLKGEEMVVDKIFINAFGLHVQGSNPRRQIVNLMPIDLNLID
ncbi:hypothetical protein [Allocoleopsis sp.]|uniref:hypothetical protein n=1 Tax=Allocoleopsis sp. TaxID=3088169 RepID=UPI002FD444A2